MELIHALWLGILQGTTEFLPISSSGHLILLPALTGWVDQGIAFDLAVHMGTLLAVLLYFRHEMASLGKLRISPPHGIMPAAHD
jgi:undecaprenyl-diphosphatase